MSTFAILAQVQSGQPKILPALSLHLHTAFHSCFFSPFIAIAAPEGSPPFPKNHCDIAMVSVPAPVKPELDLEAEEPPVWDDARLIPRAKTSGITEQFTIF